MTVTRHPAEPRLDVRAALPTRRDLLLGSGATAGAAAGSVVLPVSAADISTGAADMGDADLLTLIGCYDETARRAVVAQNAADRLYFAARDPAVAGMAEEAERRAELLWEEGDRLRESIRTARPTSWAGLAIKLAFALRYGGFDHPDDSDPGHRLLLALRDDVERLLCRSPGPMTSGAAAPRDED